MQRMCGGARASPMGSALPALSCRQAYMPTTGFALDPGFWDRCGKIQKRKIPLSYLRGIFGGA